MDLSHYHPPARPNDIKLDGRLVRLEPIDSANHGADLFEANMADGGAANWDYLPYGPFASLDMYCQWLDTMAKQSDPQFFAIIRKADEKAVGVASFLRIKPHDGSIEVGHIHFSPLLQRTTEATEAMYVMMKWAFEAGYRRYEWKCNAKNIKSRQAAQRLGFSYEGVFRQATISKGKNRDTAWFAMIDSEWPQIKQAFDTYLTDGFDRLGKKPSKSLSALTLPLLYKRDDGAFS